MFYVRSNGSHGLSFGMIVFTLLYLSTSAFAPGVAGQSTDVGNGGAHAIQGRLYVSNGRRSEIAGLKIRLTGAVAGDMWIVSDETGSFMFRGLTGGSYHLTVEGGDAFENVTENVVIDDPGSSNISRTVRMRTAPRTMNVQIYLRRKTTGVSPSRAGVVHAKWATVAKEAVESFERGLRLVQEGNDPDAEVAFRRAIEIAPTFAPARTALGRLLQRSGKLTASIEEWKTAIHYDVEDFDAHVNLGIAYVNLKRYAEAETHLVQAAFLQPTAVTPHYYIGISYVIKNDLDVAMRAFEKAKELNGGKSLPAIHKYLGRIYGAKNKPKQAVHELETYLKLAPNATDVEKVRKDISDLRSKQN